MTAAPTTDTFPTETAGLPASVDTELVELSDGDAFDLRIGPVTKRLSELYSQRVAKEGTPIGPAT